MKQLDSTQYVDFPIFKSLGKAFLIVLILSVIIFIAEQIGIIPILQLNLIGSLSIAENTILLVLFLTLGVYLGFYLIHRLSNR